MTDTWETLQIRTGATARTYPVHIGQGIAFQLGTLLGDIVGGRRVALISDDNVARLYAARVREGISARVDVYDFPAGEEAKCVPVWERLSSALLADGHDRSSIVVALGGGVTGDLAGFVASTFMRGVPVVQVPSSLLAMVDASVGGKTGVNASAGKNLLGAFHAPRAVVMDTTLLRTLPRTLRAQGLAEAVKHGAIRSRSHFDRVVRLAPALLEADAAALSEVLPESVGIKARIVAEDERESGVRSVLNFGHTLGHALERAMDYAIPHGQAVAVGMVAEARLGERLGVTAPGTAEELAHALCLCELPHEIPTDVEPATWITLTRGDKKSSAGRGRYVLLRGIGEVDPGENWLHEVAESEVEAVLRKGDAGAGPGYPPHAHTFVPPSPGHE